MRIAHEMRTRAALRLLLVGWMAVIFALSSRSHLPRPAEVSEDVLSVVGHLTVYAVLAALIWGVLPRRWPARRRLGLAFIGAMAYGLSDEWHQVFVVAREPALFDLAVDAIGALSALVLISLAARAGSASGTADPGRDQLQR